MNKQIENRKDALKAANINMNQFFSITFNEGLKPGTKLTVSLTDPDSGEVIEQDLSSDLNKLYNDVSDKITNNGYVNNSKLFRRWVMAQMFRMMEYDNYKTGKSGFTACLNEQFPYDYQFTMMYDELKVLDKLYRTDKEEFGKRSVFFNKDVVVATCNDYVDKLLKYIDSVKVLHCQGKPYKRLFCQNIYIEDIKKKLVSPVISFVKRLKYGDYKKSFPVFFNDYKCFMQYHKKLPKDTPKCAAWKDAYKGAGSYYTLLNLVRFHGCGIYHDEYKFTLRGESACKYIEEKRMEYQDEYWRMFALLKKVINDNNFNFHNRMKEVYKK